MRYFFLYNYLLFYLFLYLFLCVYISNNVNIAYLTFLAQNKKEEIAVLMLVFILTPTSPLVLVLFQFFQDR